MDHTPPPPFRQPLPNSLPRTYIRAWGGVCGVVVTLGLALACILWRPGEVLGLFLPMAYVGGAVTLSYRSSPGGVPASTRSLVASVARNATTTGLVVLATAAGLRATPALTCALLGLAALTSPWTVRAGARWAASRPRPTAHVSTAEDDTVAPGDRIPGDLAAGELAHLTHMSDADLCRQWRRSFAHLTDAPTQHARAHVVRRRQAYLDELERRHPEALAAWLASSPRAADGPEAYLRARDNGTNDAAGAT